MFDIKMKKSVKRQFDANMFSLDYDNPSRFVHGPWRRKDRVSVGFLIYRVSLVTILATGLCWSLSLTWGGGKWLIYLTNWTFLTLTMQALLGATLAVIAFRKQDRFNHYEDSNLIMPFSYKLYWLLFNCSIPLSFYVSIMYWTVVHDPKKIESPSLTFITHVLNSVLAFMDIIIGGPPSRLLHVFQPTSFGISYVMFTLIYWQLGGTNRLGEPFVYEATDWNKLSRMLSMASFSIILISLLHVMITVIAGIRSRLARRWRVEKSKFFDMNISQSTSETQEVFCDEMQ